MGKNLTFSRRYTIEIKGITTNDFATDYYDSIFDSIVQNIQSQFKQTQVIKFTAEDLRTGRVKIYVGESEKG